jgi:TonB family protein
MKKRLCLAALGLLCLNGIFTLAGPVAQQGDAQKQTPTSPNLDEATRLSQRVVSLHNQGKFDEALPLARRALEIREKHLGPEHQLVGLALKNLASLYFAKKQYDDAVRLYERTLSVYEKVFGPDDPKTADIFDSLAWSSNGAGDTSRAERCLRGALTIREKALGPDSKEVGETAYVLGQFYQRAGEYGKAADSYKRTVAIREKTLGPNSPQLAELLEKCACSLAQDHKDPEAQGMWRRASEILGNAKGYPDTKRSAVIQGKATLRAEPVYPIEAKRKHVTGTVIVEVTVDESGKVIKARSLCGPDILLRASVEAAYKWRFGPTTLSGEPVKVIGTLTFNYLP